MRNGPKKLVETAQGERGIVSIDDPQLDFFDGLFWYFEIRNWAFGKIKTCPRGSHPFDIRMHHALYFVNLVSAVDHVSDHLRGDEPTRRAFIDRIEDGFRDTQNYKYVRELRNAIIHRGLDPTAAGHADDTTVYVLCPAAVQDRGSKNDYTCTFKYTVELATHCNAVINAAITDALDRLDLFNVAKHMISEADICAAINNSAAMPEWAKALARKAVEEMDYPTLAADLAATRIKQMRNLLGHLEVEG